MISLQLTIIIIFVIAASICPAGTEPIFSESGGADFKGSVVGPREDIVDLDDALFSSGKEIKICKGDFILIKPLCPNGEFASIVLIRLTILYAQYVKVSLVGTLGTVVDSSIVSIFILHAT